MRVVFRADASLQIGTGHVMRCLTLADALRERARVQSHFICRAHPGHLADAIRARGHRVTLLPPPDGSQSIEDPARRQLAHAVWLGVGWEIDGDQTIAALKDEPVADWLVADHYALDSRLEGRVRGACRHLMAIDDLADRPHACDLLLDQNLGRVEADYAGCVPATCKIFAGSQYALLRPEFVHLRPKSLARRVAVTCVRHLLISLGGVDKDNVTGAVLAALQPEDLPASCQITVVMGAGAPWLMSVKGQAASMPWPTRVLVNVRDMAQLMLESDLAIGAAGTTSWERCCMGLPSIVFSLADNQSAIAARLSEAGVALALSVGSDLRARLSKSISLATGMLASLSREAAERVSGLGTEVIVDELTS